MTLSSTDSVQLVIQIMGSDRPDLRRWKLAGINVPSLVVLVSFPDFPLCSKEGLGTRLGGHPSRHDQSINTLCIANICTCVNSTMALRQLNTTVGLTPYIK